ncbi:hypothetical protein HanIR_Chr12g0581481 [Helianthus annuus]|nr:hypothetical protein HanIR_Chr12g0581481 [Helianthus annuus]
MLESKLFFFSNLEVFPNCIGSYIHVLYRCNCYTCVLNWFSVWLKIFLTVEDCCSFSAYPLNNFSCDISIYFSH